MVYLTTAAPMPLFLFEYSQISQEDLQIWTPTLVLWVQTLLQYHCQPLEGLLQAGAQWDSKDTGPYKTDQT